MAAAAPAVHGQEFPATRKLDPSRESFVPFAVPGFELREMNKKRHLVYVVDEQTEVELSVPVLIYFPLDGAVRRPEVVELRHIYNDLAKIAAETQDAATQTLLLRIDRLLADLGEKREIPHEYEKQNRVSSERSVTKPKPSVDIPVVALDTR